ncbi:mandelate racemase/muconate lactonizing enzyme family protein [Anaerotruncus sp. AF02-27]|uniref:mandelate racemase/muconate lactonizing enzyme family protein n=1 Tax=Anaerotruncus sp. AF02-27 TaxID=2292191 RepID=UPI000E4851EE|nr:mandelate racemase/muconate lactonizing enzyme family protein [Anaerotruncus sp. AF02-27]RGX55773.1 mandelate racemase/muconate lactonizing enzyme family protein [Anaerotruncus sp. AF02-27]
MKIREVKAHIIQAPLEEPFAFSQGWVYNRSSMIVEVICADGESGFGECLCHGMQPPQIAAAFIQNCFAPRMVGRDLFDVEVLWEELYNISRPFGQQGAAVNALSGVDIALWDAIGKQLGQPVCNLIGGKFRDKVQAYATGFYRKQGRSYPEEAIREVAGYIEKGFRGMKLKTGFGAQEDIGYIRAVREAVGNEILLMADFNCAYNQAVARRILLELQESRLEFFEELLAPEDMEGYAAIRNLTPSYIAAGENIFGKIAYKQWLEKGALDIYQPDLCSSGGFTECKKIAALTQAYNAMLIPHVWGSGVGLAASLQFIATLPAAPLCMKPKEPMLEYDQSSHPFRLDLINDGVVFRNGFVEVPNAPGIGVEINREVLKKYRIN